MAKNNPPGDGHRLGASTGRFMDVKTSSPAPFKDVRREKKGG